eukprot:SAG25_NODE_4430_length_816_cov_0.889819_1_plen_165_part_10
MALHPHDNADRLVNDAVADVASCTMRELQFVAATQTTQTATAAAYVGSSSLAVCPTLHGCCVVSKDRVNWVFRCVRLPAVAAAPLLTRALQLHDRLPSIKLTASRDIQRRNCRDTLKEALDAVAVATSPPLWGDPFLVDARVTRQARGEGKGSGRMCTDGTACPS